jgi:4-methyl-5(b-hydroxyethyl)-thiazole monophosphate biosynthesis
MPTVLAILAEGCEEIEVITPVDIMRRAGFEVTLASLNDGIHVTGRSGITLHADTTLAAVRDRPFDCIFLPGGPGVKNLRVNPEVLRIVAKQGEKGGWIAAICAAPLVLKDAGLLDQLRFTSHPSTSAELPDRLATEKVVVDRQIVTSLGAGTSLEFGMTLVKHLGSPSKAAEVATSICAE